MGFDNVCLQRCDPLGPVMHQCDIDSNAWFHCMLLEVDLWQEPKRGEKKWDINSTISGCFYQTVRLPGLQTVHVCTVISNISQAISLQCGLKIYDLSNTSDSPALNHLMSFFISWSELFCLSALGFNSIQLFVQLFCTKKGSKSPRNADFKLKGWQKRLWLNMCLLRFLWKSEGLFEMVLQLTSGYSYCSDHRLHLIDHHLELLHSQYKDMLFFIVWKQKINSCFVYKLSKDSSGLLSWKH